MPYPGVRMPVKMNDMIIFKYATQLAGHLQQQKARGAKVGFVPTMGALHQGHIALIGQSKKDTDLTVCSIFVNPTQFNNAGDFQHYPKTIEKDIVQLEAAGTDILFLPPVSEMYPTGTTGLEQYDLGFLETVLEGKYRPGHFQGVCQVMNRLLTMVQPDLLFMGQKDYQQCMVVNRLQQLTGSSTQLITFPTVREPDGLAMSSRNLRLPPADRQKAPAIYKALQLIQAGEGREAAIQLLTEQGFTIDYVELADRTTLEPREKGPAVALIAAFLGDVRLIDNMLV
jgi:pantoate--beta-alanine ligase